MANASAKRIAAQNEGAIHNLRVGMAVCIVLPALIRFLVWRQPFPSIAAAVSYLIILTPSIFLYFFLVRAGTPRRDSSGTLISPGDDLNQAGLLEWSWDIIYVTWTCQIGSSLLGNWVWWLYLIIPIYGGYKVWSTFISPMLLGRPSGAGSESEEVKESTSKRQEKLRKRQEKGDPRVRAVVTPKK